MAHGAKGSGEKVSKPGLLRLGRIKEHLANQNWTAVVLELLIVVVGVAIGFQITEWNRGRLAEDDYRVARERLIDETRENIEALELSREFFIEKKEAIGAAIAALEACETGEQALSTVTTGLDFLRQSNTPLALVAASGRITDQPELIGRQENEERLRLQRYHDRLVSWNDTVIGIGAFNDLATVDRHPVIGFGEFHISGTAGGFEQRRPVLTTPLSQACRDNSFKKLFYLAERRVNYLDPAVDARLTQLRENLNAMGAREMVVAE